MSNQVLYRKYRPKTFDEVVGQEAVVSALAKAVKENTPGHAYLFAGGRGTGKTSLARIFARSLGVSDHDTQELDAASNRGVDDVRLLNEGVYTSPMSSPYKIYIVDEVHMLTKEAFNALLKTLEEPPKHVIFILATTELDRVPQTIRSRCQVFQFNEPSRTMLEEYVASIAKQEKIKLEKGVAEAIAKAGRGSFRDTLGIMQSATDSAPTGTITLETATLVSGGAHSDDVTEFITGALGKNEIVWKLVDTKEKHHLEFFIEDVIETVRKILLLRYAPEYGKELLNGGSEESAKQLQNLTAEKRINSDFLAKLLELFMRMKETPFPEAAIVIFLAKINES